MNLNLMVLFNKLLKNGTCIKSIGTFWTTSFNVTYFNIFGVEHVPKKDYENYKCYNKYL